MEDTLFVALEALQVSHKKEKQNPNSIRIEKDLSSNIHVSRLQDPFLIIDQPEYHSPSIKDLSTLVIKQTFKRFM